MARRGFAPVEALSVPLIRPVNPLQFDFQADSLGRFAVAGLGPDAALQYLPAVQVRSYGGHGGLRTVSLRGFATNQTQVLLDGVPIENPQFGTVNLGMLQLAGLSGVQAQAGAAPDAANPGAGSIALSQALSGPKLGLTLGMGSFGEWLATLQGGIAKPDTAALRFAYQHQRARDNYPFDLNGVQGEREAARFANHQLSLAGALLRPIKGAGLLDGGTWGVRYGAVGRVGSQQVPAAVVSGNPTGLDERMNQQQALQYATLYLQRGPHKWAQEGPRRLLPHKLWLSVKQQYDFTEYFFQGSRQVYTLHLGFAELGAYWSSTLGQTLLSRWHYQGSVRFQGQLSNLSGNNLAQQEGLVLKPLASVQRIEGHGAASFSLNYYCWNKPHVSPASLTLSSRTNAVQGYAPQPNAFAALFVPLTPQAHVAALGQVSQSARIPAFNELYFYGYGNSTLPPERTQQVEGGLFLRFSRWYAKADGVVGPAQPMWNHLTQAAAPTVRFPIVAELTVQGFAGRTQNKIIALPISPVRWSTLSIGQTQTTGLEARLALAFGRSVRLTAHYTLQRAWDEALTSGRLLPYTPQEVAGLSILGRIGPVQLSVNALYNGWRYPTLANDPNHVLPAYWLLDAAAVYRRAVGPLTLELALSAQNLLNTRYEVIRSYPMPGRSLRLEVAAYW